MVHNENCCSNNDYISGCMVCGLELYCSPEVSVRAKCYYCGKEYITNTFCIEGHYVCDKCHSIDILKLVDQICNDSDLSDPAELALQIFDLKMLHMHGPEYHSIVPAVLVTAYLNSILKRDTAAIREAISRGEKIFGGVCGTHGACGACIGVGVAYSIIHKVTPFSKEKRGEANRMTALALMAISEYGGPRCCKRDCMIAIETAKQHFGVFDNSVQSRYKCSQFMNNHMCIHNDCPFYPKE